MGREGRGKGKGESLAPQPPKAGDANVRQCMNYVFEEKMVVHIIITSLQILQLIHSGEK